MKKNQAPYLITLMLLICMAILSLAIGSVSIPLDTLIQLVSNRLGLAIAPANSDVFAAILFRLRLPRTILIALRNPSQDVAITIQRYF